MEEEYEFLTLYSADLGEALRAATLIKRRLSREMRGIILQHLVVAYARPFSGNRGTTIKSHRLEQKFVPVSSRELHDRLIGHRDRYFAHTDHDAYSPKVLPFPSARGQSSLMVMYSCPPKEQLLALLPEIVDLISSVAKGVESERERIERLLIASDKTR